MHSAVRRSFFDFGQSYRQVDSRRRKRAVAERVVDPNARLFTCRVCTHEWPSRSQKPDGPAVCPHCQSGKWRTGEKRMPGT